VLPGAGVARRRSLSPDPSAYRSGVERTRPSRRKLQLLIGAIVVLAIAGTTATALTPRLATRDPLLLIMLEARNRNLVLARHVDLLPFVVVGTLRRMISDPLYWLLGTWYGDKAIRWLEEKAGGGALVRVTEQFFTKAAYPMVFLFPGAVVCALAGATGMPFPAFVVTNLAGTITMVILLRLAGDVLSGPVDAVLGFFDRNLVTTTAITIALVVLSLILQRAQGKAEVPSVKELEDDGVDAGDQAGPADENRPGGTSTPALEAERDGNE
jgi:membrane protein DedA with SNARE-associated domain